MTSQVTCNTTKYAFTLSIGLGLLTWVLSPLLTGQREPWDASGPYYMISLFTAGFVPSLIEPRRFWAWPIGVYLGQVLFLLGATVFWVVTDGGGANLVLVGVVLMPLFMWPTILGAGIGAAARKVVERVRARAGRRQR